VSIEKGTGGYKDSNRIKAFLFDQGDSSPAPARKASAPAAKSAAPAAKSSNPWD
jgi:hypothetical protein